MMARMKEGCTPVWDETERMADFIARFSEAVFVGTEPTQFWPMSGRLVSHMVEKESQVCISG